MNKTPFAKKAVELEVGSIEWMIEEAKRKGYVYADNRFLLWVDTRIGKPVGDLFRSCLVSTRQWMIRNGLPVGKIRLDDLISYVFIGIKRTAQGRAAEGSFSRTLASIKNSGSFKSWFSSVHNSGASSPLALSSKSHEVKAHAFDIISPTKSPEESRRLDLSAAANESGIDKATGFDKWFDDSKIVDSRGEPLPLYHGTSAKFTVFDKTMMGARDPGFFGSGIYMTTDLADAESYAESAAEDNGLEGGGVVMKLYASIQNPFVWDVSSPDAASNTIQKLKSFGINKEVMDRSTNLSNSDERRKFDAAVRAAGHDGVITVTDASNEVDIYIPMITEVIAFNPEQIKSASDNNGQFNPKSPDILFSRSAHNTGSMLDLSYVADGNEIREYKIGDSRLVLNATSDKITISSVRTPQAKRGNGSARAAMKALIEQADAQSINLTLGASALDSRTSTSKLVSFYQSLGFELTGKAINPLGDPEMERKSVAKIMDAEVPFGINMAELELPLDILAARNELVPISSVELAEPTRLPLGSIRVAEFGNAEDRYVDVLRKVPVESLLISEPEDNVRNTPIYHKYVQWAKEGREAPAIQVNENDRGELISANRRRALAAKEAGLLTITAWVSPINPETGNPLKYGDLAKYKKTADITSTTAFKKWFEGSKAVDENGMPLIAYHGTSGDISVFNTHGGTGKTFGTGAFFTSSAAIASTYTGGINGGNIVPVYLNLQNPAIFDAAGANWDRLGKKTKVSLPAITVSDQDDEDLVAELTGREPQKNATKKLRARNTTLEKLFPNEFLFDDFFSTDEVARWARTQGYDSVVINNVRDQGPSGVMATDESKLPATMYVAFDPAQIKSVLGNNGEFNPAKPDIMFSRSAGKKAAISTNEISANDWFAGSKIVDENGQPLIVYHGTTYEFESFVPSEGDGNHLHGIYFAREAVRNGTNYTADYYIDNDKGGYIGGGRIIPVYLSIKNPASMNDAYVARHELGDSATAHQISQLLKQKGFDGYADDNEIIAFDSEQVRFAFGNNADIHKINSNDFIREDVEHKDQFKNEKMADSSVAPFTEWFGDGKIVDKNGNPKVVYHGTNNTNSIHATYSSGSETAVAELKRLAEKHGLPDWTSVHGIFERWVRTGIAEKYGVTPEMAVQAREMREASKSVEVTPAREEIGFSEFNMPDDGLELGAHFGTQKQAEAFGTVFKFYLNFQNPIRLPDLGTWNYQSVMRELRRNGVAISEEEYDTVFNARDNNQALRELMLSKGIDGVVYKNEAEGKGDSYIALKPDQIRSADVTQNGHAAVHKTVSACVDFTLKIPELTENALLLEVARNFPRLLPAVETIFAKGKANERGGAIIVNAQSKDEMAAYIATRTGFDKRDFLEVLDEDGSVNGLHEANTGLTFIIGKNITPQKGVAVLLHEVTHSQNMDRVNLAAMTLLNSRHNESDSVKQFLDRVADRLGGAGETGNAKEVLPYIIEQAVIEHLIDPGVTSELVIDSENSF